MWLKIKQRNGNRKRLWKKQVKEVSMDVGLRRDGALFRSKLSVFFCSRVVVNLVTLTSWGHYQI